MDSEYFRLFYDYHYWARDRLLKAAEGLSEEDFSKPNGFNYGSIRGIFTHLVNVESIYTARWRGDPAAVQITEADVPTVEALSERWSAIEAGMRAWIAGVTDADLDAVISTPRRTGGEYVRRLGMDMAQIANHGTQHRSEAAEALTMVGRSPGNLDLSVYIQEMDLK